MCFESNHHVKGRPHLFFKVLKGGNRFYVRYAAGDQVFFKLPSDEDLCPPWHKLWTLPIKMNDFIHAYFYTHIDILHGFTCILNVIPIISW